MMTGAEWRKLDPDCKTVDERGQHWLLQNTNGRPVLCPVRIVAPQKTQPERTIDKAAGR